MGCILQVKILVLRDNRSYLLLVFNDWKIEQWCGWTIVKKENDLEKERKKWFRKIKRKKWSEKIINEQFERMNKGIILKKNK